MLLNTTIKQTSERTKKEHIPALFTLDVNLDEGIASSKRFSN